MNLFRAFLRSEERRAALLLYGLIIAIAFNGYGSGIMTVILSDDQFKEYYQANSLRLGTIATVPTATISLAQLCVAGVLARWVGRLWTIRLGIGISIVGVTLCCIPNTFGVLILGRLMVGLGTGVISISVSLYTAECAPTRLRGSFVGTVTQFGYQLGTLIAFWTGYGLSFRKSPENTAWRTSMLAQIPIGITFTLVSFLYPESPRWLLEKYPKEPHRALTQLAYFRSASLSHIPPKVREEFHELVASYEYRKHDAPGYLGLFRNPALRKRLAYGFYATALQQIGGIAAVTMFAASIYKSLGWDQGSQHLAINGIQASLQLLIVLVSTFTVDKFGRRPLLLTGFMIQSLAMLIMASLTTSFPHNDNKRAAVAEVAMLFVFGLTYCCTNGPICFIVATEIFPQHVRETALGLSLLGQSICLIALTQPWPYLNEKIGGRSYWLLCGLNILALISVTFILPETKGVSLERMDKLFGEVDSVEGGELERANSRLSMETNAYKHVNGEIDEEIILERRDVILGGKDHNL